MIEIDEATTKELIDELGWLDERMARILTQEETDQWRDEIEDECSRLFARARHEEVAPVEWRMGYLRALACDINSQISGNKTPWPGGFGAIEGLFMASTLRGVDETVEEFNDWMDRIYAPECKIKE